MQLVLRLKTLLWDLRRFEAVELIEAEGHWGIFGFDQAGAGNATLLVAVRSEAEGHDAIERIYSKALTGGRAVDLTTLAVLDMAPRVLVSKPTLEEAQEPPKSAPDSLSALRFGK